jgi:hypothetical protein
MSRLTEYLVAGYSFGVAVSRIRVRELVMVTAVTETALLVSRVACKDTEPVAYIVFGL